MKIQIHKNDLKAFFLENCREKTKIGEERMKRWIDIPEYIQIEVDEKVDCHCLEIAQTHAINCKNNPDFINNLRQRLEFIEKCLGIEIEGNIPNNFAPST